MHIHPRTEGLLTRGLCLHHAKLLDVADSHITTLIGLTERKRLKVSFDMPVRLGGPIEVGVRDVVDVSKAQQDALLVDTRLQGIYGLSEPEEEVRLRLPPKNRKQRYRLTTLSSSGCSFSASVSYCSRLRMERKPSRSLQVEYFELKA